MSECYGTVDESGKSIIAPKKGSKCNRDAMYCVECVDAMLIGRDNKIKELRATLEKAGVSE
jgi:hypothetical protein